jgi:UDP-3-O-[3-hydroxymyristoyl] glucosamine N-acyltransferase
VINTESPWRNPVLTFSVPIQYILIMWSFKDLCRFSEIISDADCTFEALGFVDTPYANSLTFSLNQVFLKRAIENPNISAVLTTSDLAGKVDFSNKVLICNDPQFVFFQFHNLVSPLMVRELSSQIDESAIVAQTSIIGSQNVIIGPGTIIEDYCVIKRNTKIGARTRIQSGSIIGATGIYVAKDSLGNRLLGEHFGYVEIGDNVDIGSNSVIDKGIFPNDRTFIASNNFLGSSIQISHGVEIQEGNTIASGALISGYTKIGSDNWIGPGAIVSNGLEIGSRNYIALGSTLFKGINNDTKVIGNKIFTDRSLF